MRHWILAPFLLAALATAALAKPKNTAAEATQVMEQFLGGSMGANQALNRIQFLGQERFAASETCFALNRTSDERLRGQLLDFLASLGVRTPDVERAFVASLQSDNTGEAMSAARGLGKLKSESAVKPMIELLTHPMLGVRREVARALGNIGRPQASAPLLKASKVEADLEVKMLMIASAGRAGDKKVARELEELLKSESELTRLAAAQGLCALGVPACAAFANKLLASADKAQRFQAVSLFEGASARTAAPVLEKVLADSDPKLRARAARILVQGGDAKRIDWLVIESAKAKGEERLVYEDELEKLRLTDEQRQAVLKKAGLQ